MACLPELPFAADDAYGFPDARKTVGTAQLISIQFQRTLSARLRRGEHVVLYGPRGGGKSTLLAVLHAQFLQNGVPCGSSPQTGRLDDITQALERAYPDVETAAVTRRRAQGRLRLRADSDEGVLLLDHVTRVGTQAVGLLRRLRGGIAGVLLVVDVETERERKRLRMRHLGTCSLAMPAVPTRTMRHLLRNLTAAHDLPPLAPAHEPQLLRAARGRPGWLITCVDLLRQGAYRRNGDLYASVLSADTEIALRGESLSLSPQSFAGRAAPGGAGAARPALPFVVRNIPRK